MPSRWKVADAVLLETRDGSGVEASPDAWRSRAIVLLDDAVRRGAGADRARELVRGFLARMDARFASLESAVKRWVYDRRRIPLDAHQQEVWRAVVFFDRRGRRIDLPGYIDAAPSVPLHLGEAPHEDLERVAVDLDELAERAAIGGEGGGDA